MKFDITVEVLIKSLMKFDTFKIVLFLLRKEITNIQCVYYNPDSS